MNYIVKAVKHLRLHSKEYPCKSDIDYNFAKCMELNNGKHGKSVMIKETLRRKLSNLNHGFIILFYILVKYVSGCVPFWVDAPELSLPSCKNSTQLYNYMDAYAFDMGLGPQDLWTQCPPPCEYMEYEVGD